MMILSAADPTGAPAIARGLGARVADGGACIEVFISRTQWPDAVSGLTPGAQVAATFVQPATYESYQLKGRVLDLGPADSAGAAFASAYMDRILQMLGSLGVRQQQVQAFLALNDPVRLRFAPSAVYLQTPGPGAGRPLAALA
jgi:hypothetical protein